MPGGNGSKPARLSLTGTVSSARRVFRPTELFSKLPYVSWVWSCEVTCVRATANPPCSGEWSDRWQRERLRQNLLRPNLGFWRPQVTSGWLIGCKFTLVRPSENKDKRGKTLTTVYQHHEQSYSSAHGGVRRQGGSICSRSFTVRFC